MSLVPTCRGMSHLSYPGGVTMGKLLDPSVPQFSCLSEEFDDNISLSINGY